MTKLDYLFKVICNNCVINFQWSVMLRGLTSALMFDLGAETSVARKAIEDRKVFFFILLNVLVIINTFVIKSENNPFLNVRELFL